MHDHWYTRLGIVMLTITLVISAWLQMTQYCAIQEISLHCIGPRFVPLSYQTIDVGVTATYHTMRQYGTSYLVPVPTARFVWRSIHPYYLGYEDCMEYTRYRYSVYLELSEARPEERVMQPPKRTSRSALDGSNANGIKMMRRKVIKKKK